MNDIRVCPTLQPVRRWLRFAQRMKLAPILIGETYRLQLRVENLTFHSLENVVLYSRVGIRTDSGLKHFPAYTTVPEKTIVGHIAARDRVSILSTRCQMVEIGAGDIEVQTAHSLREQWSVADRSLYFVESWNVIVGRLTAVIVVLTFLLTVLTNILHWWLAEP